MPPAPEGRSGIHRCARRDRMLDCQGLPRATFQTPETPMIRFTRLAGVLALAATTSIAFAADPIKIGVDGPFTGGSSSMGVSMRDGVRLATDEINKAGGVLGRPIQLVE